MTITAVPDAFVFMKVGKHAGEDFDTILQRKNLEFERTGRIFWGYGGRTCHPTRHVQPFARVTAEASGNVFFLMELIDSHADPDIVPATEYSADGVHWMPIPDGIRVTGSRYALVLDEIKPGDLEICPAELEVAVGPSRGRPASDYLRGRVDKACLKMAQARKSPSNRETRRVDFCSHLLDPYAVLLR